MHALSFRKHTFANRLRLFSIQLSIFKLFPMLLQVIMSMDVKRALFSCAMGTVFAFLPSFSFPTFHES